MYKRICIYSILFMFFLANKVFSAEKAILVTQPAYHSMSFYVYKPYNLPSEFFATYDGYLVYKNAQGIWNYASNEKSNIKKTDYVVGAVIPSVIKLKPYDPKISSVAPILGTDKVPVTIELKPVGERISQNETIPFEINSPKILEIDVTPINMYPNKSPEILYNPPSSTSDSQLFYTKNFAEWTQNSNFMAITKWQNTVDRIGVLDIPKTPIAWKGDYPEVIYVWTGLQWWQISAKRKHVNALNTIRRENYNLILHTNKLNALNWNDDDTYILAQLAKTWDYKWVGQITINKKDEH